MVGSSSPRRLDEAQGECKHRTKLKVAAKSIQRNLLQGFGDEIFLDFAVLIRSTGVVIWS